MNLSIAIAILMVGLFSVADDAPLSGPFGSKPIQLSIGSGGITRNKVPGFICSLEATLGGGKYSEWGETEKDARIIVHKKCSDKSGLLLCKKDRVTCKQEK